MRKKFYRNIYGACRPIIALSSRSGPSTDRIVSSSHKYLSKSSSTRAQCLILTSPSLCPPYSRRKRVTDIERCWKDKLLPCQARNPGNPLGFARPHRLRNTIVRRHGTANIAPLSGSEPFQVENCIPISSILPFHNQWKLLFVCWTYKMRMKISSPATILQRENEYGHYEPSGCRIKAEEGFEATFISCPWNSPHDFQSPRVENSQDIQRPLRKGRRE